MVGLMGGVFCLNPYPSASNVQYDAGYPCGIFRSKEEGRPCNVLRRAKASYWVGVEQRLLLRSGYALLVAFGEDCFRSNAVRPDAVRPHLGGDILGHDLNTGFRGGVRDG